MVTIDSGKVEASNKFREVPKSKWRSLVRARRTFLAVHINYDCRCIVEFCEEAEVVWEELGYQSAADMIENGYELDPVEIELAIAWLKHNGVDKAISLPEVCKRQKIQQLRTDNPDWTQQQMADEVGVSQQYVNQVTSKSSQKEQSLVMPSHIEGNSSKADFRKLHPELQQQAAQKAISLNAAAIKAGIRNKPTPEDVCVKAFGKCNDKVSFAMAIISELDDTQLAFVIDQARR